jgi:hypothetical protein
VKKKAKILASAATRRPFRFAGQPLPPVVVRMEGGAPRAAPSSARIANVNFDVTQEVAAALRALRDTGFFGNGTDCASVAEELLRRALLDPENAKHWRKP